MKVCDHCHEAIPIKNIIKLNGRTFELCADCSEALIARIETPIKPLTGFAKLGGIFQR